MFPRANKPFSRLIAHSKKPRLQKLFALVSAVLIVGSLVPIPKNLQLLFAAVDSSITLVEGEDIIVNDASDNGSAINCNIYPVLAASCGIRSAVELAMNTPGPNRIIFDKSIYGDIALNYPLEITDADPLTIEGTIVANEPAVRLLPSVDFDSNQEGVTVSACTSTATLSLPLIHIAAYDVTITHLKLTGSSDYTPGNIVEIVNGGNNTILENWIGADSRDPSSFDYTATGASGHGVCIHALDNPSNDNVVEGNIIVGSRNDGIRVEGGYVKNGNTNAFDRITASGSIIANNLIGNLTGEEERGIGDAYQGNDGSGITLKNADGATIRHNIITNNGSPLAYGDGITLLESNDNFILGNFIGTAPISGDDSAIAGTFPLPLIDDISLDLPANINSALHADGHNGCDGIAIRFYDVLTLSDAPKSCPEEATAYDLPNSSGDADTMTPLSSQLLGPSINNKFFNNTIAYNHRNGVYIQSLACNIHSQLPVRHNLPNIILNDDNEPVIIQSVQNTFVQNAIFFNDSRLSNLTTGSGSYGIGIDLEDYATAALDIPDSSSFDGSYWETNGLDRTSYECSDELPYWQPNQPDSSEVDFNISENDNYDLPLVDIAFDPDAGANRLINAPSIDASSTATEITGIAPQGSLVEVYQVICTTGNDKDQIPSSYGDIRSDCDIDFWNEEDENGNILDRHSLGHGQGYRFLGSTYVDEDSVDGSWLINPADFVDPNEDISVQSFTGGIITATATAVTTACWDSETDDNDAHLCNADLTAASSDDLSAAAAGSVGAGTGIWVPGDLPEACWNGLPPNESDPDYHQLLSAVTIDCFGSTSEFSANAYIAEPAYELTKQVSTPDVEFGEAAEVAPGDTVSYTITLTNTGSSVLDLVAGTLSDELDPSLTYVSCSWAKSDLNGDLGGGNPETGSSCSGTGDDVLNTTNFGTLESDARLTIVITATVNSDLSGDACTISNTVTVGDDVSDTLGAIATETGSTLLDHTADELTVSPCGGPSLVVQKTVSVSGSAETTVNTSASSSAPLVPVSGAITYYIDIANPGAEAVTGLVVTDTFPSQLGTSSWTCASATASGSTLTNHTSVTYNGSCSVNTSTGVITTATTVGTESVLRIRLTGRTVPTAVNTTVMCNSVTATGDDDLSATDSACVRIGVPVLAMTKSASDTTPAAGDTVVYTMTVTNNGGYTANDVVISDDLDDSTVGNTLIPQCVASSANITVQDSGAINSSTNTVTWSLGSIPVGTTRTVHFTAVMRNDLTTATSCPNVARTTSSNASSTTATTTVALGIPVDDAILSINKTVVNESDVYELGDDVRYRVTVTNTGTSTSSNLSVRDSIPAAEEDIRSATSTSGTVSTDDDELVVTDMSVAGDASATINYTVSIVDGDEFPLRNYRLDADADSDDDQFYAERVRDEDIADSDYNDADAALGARDDEYVSLGSGGEIILDIANRTRGLTKLVVNGDGDDFCIAEQDLAADGDRSTERYTVSVSQTTRSRDFERVGRSRSDSDCFDISDADLPWIRYIQIEDTSGSVSGDAPGVDIDAVCLLNLGGMVTNTAGLYQGDDLLGTSEENILVNFTEAFEDPATERDCRTTAVTVANDPLPPPPLEPLPPAPVYVAPPVFQLPKTGAATLPALGSTGVMGALWWIIRRIRK